MSFHDPLFKLFQVGFTFWLGLIAYSFISALFNLCIFRKTYLEILRYLYRLLGFKIRSSFQANNLEDRRGSLSVPRTRSFATFRHTFKIDDACSFVTDGIGVIVDDEVTKSFSTEEVEEWNFLTRTQVHVSMSLKVELLLLLSIVFRFGLFFFVRLPIGIVSLLWLLGTMCVFSVLNSVCPHSPLKNKAERYCSIVCCRLLAQTFSAVISIHNPF